MGKKGSASLSLEQIFNNLQMQQPQIVHMSKWQYWTIAFHMIAVKEGLDCVEIRSEEQKQEERKEAMLVKTKMPADWI